MPKEALEALEEAEEENSWYSIEDIAAAIYSDIPDNKLLIDAVVSPFDHK